MVSKVSERSIARQCRLLNVPRSSFYYQPAPIPAEELALMRLIDACHLEHPCTTAAVASRAGCWTSMIG